MNNKKITLIFLSVGSIGGSYSPLLWGGSVFSFSSLFLGALGAIIGIWISFKIISS